MVGETCLPIPSHARRGCSSAGLLAIRLRLCSASGHGFPRAPEPGAWETAWDPEVWPAGGSVHFRRAFSSVQHAQAPWPCSGLAGWVARGGRPALLNLSFFTCKLQMLLTPCRGL